MKDFVFINKILRKVKRLSVSVSSKMYTERECHGMVCVRTRKKDEPSWNSNHMPCATGADIPS